MADRMSEQEAGRFLREATGTQWSLLTYLLYLSGKEALAAIAALPEDCMTKQALEQATKVAAFAVANARAKSTPLCASDLAKQYKGQEAI